MFPSLESLSALDGYAGLLFVLLASLDARDALLVSIIGHQLGKTDRKLNLDETAGSFLRATHRLGVHVELTDNSNPLLGVYLENRARLTCDA